MALQYPCDEDNILDLEQHGSDKDRSDQEFSNSGGSDEEFMTERMTSVLMGVVTVVVTGWSRTLTRERN